MLPQRVLLVYEEIPERTVILYLGGTDLAEAGLTFAQLASIHGTYVNATEMTDAQQEIHDKVNQAIFGEWDEDRGIKDEAKPALWQSAKIFQTDDESLNKEGYPPKIDSGAIVVHCGFALESKRGGLMHGLDIYPSREPQPPPSPQRFESWRWFCGACKGMTLQQIEEAAGAPWGTILNWSMRDQVPIAAYIAVRDFPSEKRRL